ncbi:nucleotidyltransferase family protein, partial [bacterium]|nr:nucleotidyltransferase family protein [bacterium]
HFVNSSIQFIEWSTREQMIDSSKVILPESLDINNLKKIAEHNNIKSYIQERLNSLNIRITDEKAITSDIIRSELFKQAYKYFGNLLKTNDIPYIPFKGIDFAQRYYDCFHDRAMADIDLMVQKRDLGKIVDIISKNNCPISIISHLEIDSKLHHHIQIRLDKFNGLLVELHWKYCFLNYKCDLNHDLSRKLVIQNDKNFLFSNEANLCFASIHFLAGTENILRILIDVLLILQKSKIDFRKLEQTATYLNCRKRVGKVLTFVSFLRKNFQHDYQPTYSKTTLRPKIRNAFLKHVISKTKKLSIIEKILLRTLTTETLTDFLKYSMNRIIFRLK